MALHCKAVLFDFDGTLVDSSEGIYKSLIYAFEADGKPIPDEATLRKFIGPPIYDSFKNLFGYKDEKILEERNLLADFDYLGGTDFDNISSDKTVIMQNAMHALGVSPQETVMVGDRLFDIRGAKGAGVPCIAVLYGFGSREEFEEYGADYIVRTPQEIETLIFGG